MDKTERPSNRSLKRPFKRVKPAQTAIKSSRDRQEAGPKGNSSNAAASPRPSGSQPAARHAALTGRQQALPPAQAEAAPPVFRRASAELSVLYGLHTVRAALRARRRKVLAVFATGPVAERMAGDFLEAGVTPLIVRTEDLARRLGPNAVHQGIMIEARPLEPIDLSDIIPQSGIVLALDQITDPHNAGAILRTAAAFGVDAVVTTERHSPELSGVMAKAASGGLDYVPVALIGNFARALERLADMGYLRVGFDSEAPIDFQDAALTRPVVLVLGGEGKGLRRLSREKCDLLVRLDMPGPIKSLNVSNACAIALSMTRQKLILA